MLKEQSRQITAEQIARELRDVRSQYEGLRLAVRALRSRTSQLYLQLDRLKASKENRNGN